MHVAGLGHVNIRTPDFEETVSFYERCLGLDPQPGPAAAPRAQNVWLHDPSGRAVIHVNGSNPGEIAYPVGSRSRLDHFALDCVGLQSCIDRLDAVGVPFERVHITARGLVQLNIHDPNGIKVELTFAEPG